MSYSEALEQQVKLLRWVDSSSGKHYFQGGLDTKLHSTGDFRNFSSRDLVRHVLEHAATYFCARPILQVLRSSAADLPANCRMDLAMLPAPEGFVWFQETLTGRGPGGDHIRALSWVASQDALHLLPWSDLSRFGRSEYVPLGVYPWRYGRQLSEAGQDNPADQVGDDYSVMGDEVYRFAAALFLFVQQRILVAPRHRAERHARKRLERDGWTHEPLVQVVELRRKQSRPNHADEHDAVDWACQWVVSGHWRNQWYPSIQAYQPRWIMPYVKGPDDKPLKPPRAKVWAVVR